MDRDPSLDALLELDGQVLVIDSDIRRWVRSAVRRVPASEAKPHGLDYSLTLHGPDGERWRVSTTRIRLGAGRGPGGKTGSAFDHKQRLKTVRPYEYKDAATLLADFRSAVDAVLREKGIAP